MVGIIDHGSELPSSIAAHSNIDSRGKQPGAKSDSAYGKGSDVFARCSRSVRRSLYSRL